MCSKMSGKNLYILRNKRASKTKEKEIFSTSKRISLNQGKATLLKSERPTLEAKIDYIR